MKLIKARVTNYKSIDDSEWVTFEDTTCLVGKNESGKTAFLQALQKINSADVVSGDFDILDYPRKGYLKYQNIHEKKPADVISVIFELTDAELKEIESEYGSSVLQSKKVGVTKNYKNERSWDIQIDESKAVNHFLTETLSQATIQQYPEVMKISSCTEMTSFFESKKESLSEFEPAITKVMKKITPSLDECIVSDFLDRYIPQFIYFDDYNILRGNVSISELKRLRDTGQLDPSDRTLLALFDMVNTTIDSFENHNNYENLKAQLEAASIGITDEIFAFWSQNKELEVEFDIAQGNSNDPAPLNSGTILHIRIRNNRHRVTVSFDQRSRGFIWFFSFLVVFSKYESVDTNSILLLDEPGLSLHAKAQGDFLKFIYERLAPKHQVVYTTHSPFMIDPFKLQNVRTVQDIDNRGTVVSSDILRNDRDTVFPLQAALGYNLAQSLFIGPNCLLVEGPSDFIYLQMFSQMCESQGLEQLNPGWVIVPVGGADKISTFVSLLGGNQLNTAVLMDISSADRQRFQRLQENGFLSENSIIDVGQIIGKSDADIEDLFEPKFYLNLVNNAYSKNLSHPIELSDLEDMNPRIVKQIEAYFKANNFEVRFNHYLPSAYLLKHQTDLLKNASSETTKYAESLFKKINELLPK